MRLPATIRAALAATAAALLVTLLPARPAWAHAQLLSTDPADGASVTTPVMAVTLTFNQPVKQQFSTVVVTGSDGAGHGQGAPRSTDSTLTQGVGALPPGPVRVVWRTVSSDGHPIEGQFTFTSAAGGSASPAAAAAVSPSPSRQGAAGQSDRAAGLWWIVAAVALVAVVGGGFWYRMVQRRSASAAAARRKAL
ncbi:copper resistance CopC family protein [Dactylosporangium sp. CA-092794]|uniref:copper resistance CopC family protein n=1 Tax=Dactylosporangium sp. CA-092794 TaxID=3239929 RepID=UPI003D8E17B1